MKKFLLLILMLCIMYFFPLQYFSFPNTWTLAAKDWLRNEVSQQTQSTQHEENNKTNTSTKEDAINEIKMGMARSKVEQLLGKPADKLLNAYGTYWYVYHQHYRNFKMVAYEENKVAGIYTLATAFRSIDHIKMGMTQSQVQSLLGNPLQVMEGPEYRLNINEKNTLLYERNENYFTYYFDQHENHQLVGMKIISKALENKKRYLYPNPSEALQRSYEKMDYYLINVDRVKRGIKPVTYHKKIARTALKHAEDMAENNYFSHVNLKHENPFDRMTKDHLDYLTAGENLAFGQASPIEAHHGLMNSLGHRKNILNKEFEQVGIGVAFDRHNAPYYAENYITER